MNSTGALKHWVWTPRGALPKDALSLWMLRKPSQNYSFRGPDGFSPQSDLVLDGRNLYGTTFDGGLGHGEFPGGTAFKLEFSNGQWTERVLHSFDGPPLDGTFVMSGVALRRDATGLHIFGMTQRGGPGECVLGCGVLYEITRQVRSAP